MTEFDWMQTFCLLVFYQESCSDRMQRILEDHQIVSFQIFKVNCQSGGDKCREEGGNVEQRPERELSTQTGGGYSTRYNPL